jgi:hydrogenase-1 operon protein HyaE
MTAPLIDALTKQHGLPRLVGDDLDAFLAGETEHLLFVAGDPVKYPEALDVAVILPELIRAFAGRFDAAVIASGDEQRLMDWFGVSRLPTLILLRGDAYLGAISRVRDWADYLGELERLLLAEPVRPPGVGVPVRAESRTGASAASGCG